MKRKLHPLPMLLCLALLFAQLAGCGAKSGAPEEGGATPAVTGPGSASPAQGGFSQPYPFTDGGSILLVEAEGGYDVYVGTSAADARYLAALRAIEGETGYGWEHMTGEVQTEDLDGDGVREIGLTADNGNILWYGCSPQGGACTFREIRYAEVGLYDLPPELYPEAMPEDFELAVEDLPELLPDVLGLRGLEYGEMPLFETQEAVSMYALWNFLWGRTEFECRLTKELAPDDGKGSMVLENACEAARAYYLFGAYTVYDMYVKEDGDPESVYAKVKLLYSRPEWDLEARAEALEFVMKNPVPEGGFTDFAHEMQYAWKIHDYVACKVTYDPIGYEPGKMQGLDCYEALQEAYNVLGEGQETAVCAGYARAFALIAQYAGINCAWVRGNVTEDDVGHAWNVIYPCDGSEPVLVDVTWDDGMSDDVPGQTEVSHYYFYLPLSGETEHQAVENMQDFLQFPNEGVG